MVNSVIGIFIGEGLWISNVMYSVKPKISGHEEEGKSWDLFLGDQQTHSQHPLGCKWLDLPTSFFLVVMWPFQSRVLFCFDVWPLHRKRGLISPLFLNNHTILLNVFLF